MPDSLVEHHKISVGQERTVGLAPAPGHRFWVATCQNCDWEIARWTWSEAVFMANFHAATT